MLKCLVPMKALSLNTTASFGTSNWTNATVDPENPAAATISISSASSTSEGTTVTATCGSSSKAIKVVVVELEINNSSNPTKGTSNDSDDYFFRGSNDDDVKIYYDFLPTGISPDTVKMIVKNSYLTWETIDLSTSGGSNKLAEWDVSGDFGEDYQTWEFKSKIEMVKGTQTLTSEEHSIADLLYKHRPIVYRHTNELSGPQEVTCMMDSAKLYKDAITNDLLNNGPSLTFNDISGPNDATDRFQDLLDTKRKVNEKPNVVYCRGTEQSDYIFLQYWHFEPSSCKPSSTTVYHEGDWEMFQVAVEPNTTDEELQPISITASQHYYGQTIRWDSNGSDNGPDDVDQDYVGKSGHQPKIYIALNAHATYFRSGQINVDSWPPLSTANSGCQYETGWSLYKDTTGTVSYSYTPRIFHNALISDWQGSWGEEQWGIGGSSDDGPRSPKYRATAKTMWTDPKGFNNYYRKRDSYPSGAYSHPETNIP